MSRWVFLTIDHIFALKCLDDHNKARKKKLYCWIIDFRKAFNTILRDQLFDRLKSLEIPDNMIWAFYALYEQVSKCVWCPSGLSNCFTSAITTRLAQLPTPFGIHIDEITNNGIVLGGMQVHLILYPDDMFYSLSLNTTYKGTLLP